MPNNITVSGLKRSGFTVLELILVIGMLAVIALIVIAAINPTEQLSDTNDSKRRLEARELENAAIQYVIDGTALTGLASDIADATPVCQGAVTGAACTGGPVNGYDLSGLIPDYLVQIPVDPTQTGSTLTGFYIYADKGTFIKICNPSTQATCGANN